MLERKTFPNAFEFKAGGSTGEFEGYGSIFGNVDLGGDVVMPGCFTRSLAERGGVAGVKFLWHHDMHQPIGKWLSVAEDSKGLHVKGKFTLAVARAAEVHALMMDGAIDGLSIGYQTVKAMYDESTDVRSLIDVNLYEISSVTMGMNPEATVETVKSAITAVESRKDAETLLRNLGMSRREATAFVAKVKSLDGEGNPPGDQITAILDRLKAARKSLTI